MSFLVSPGVHVREVDLTNVVPAVATSIGAIAGAFQKGPVSSVTTIGSEEELVKIFGKPQTSSNQFETFFTATNFLQYANNLKVVRVESGILNAGANSGILIRDDDHYQASFDAGQGSHGEWAARTAGTWGNSIGVQICASATAYEQVLGASYLTVTEDAVGSTSIQVDDYFDDKYAERLYKQLKPFEGVNGKCFITLNSNYNVNQVKKRNQDVTEPHFGPFTYWNRAGLTNVNPDMPVPQKDCVWPTNHMVIKHDGDVLLCCCDWEYKVVHGNVFTDRIEEVWTNASFQHYRDTLKQGRRDKLRMCRKCNKGSFNNEADRIENLKVWMEKKSIGESVSETI